MRETPGSRAACVTLGPTRPSVSAMAVRSA